MSPALRPASGATTSPARTPGSYQLAPVVVSTRAAAGLAEDQVGPLLSDFAATLGFTAREPVITPDGAAVGRTLRGLLHQDAPEVIITSGGTGLSPDDTTPEEASALIDTAIPGIMEAVRAHGRHSTPLAALSRGVAGLAGTTVIVTLPGSPRAVSESLEVLADLLPHLCDQVADLRRGHQWGE